MTLRKPIAATLVGEFDRSTTLKPASISGQLGVGLAAGIEKFKLLYEQ